MNVERTNTWEEALALSFPDNARPQIRNLVQGRNWFLWAQRYGDEYALILRGIGQDGKEHAMLSQWPTYIHP